MNEAVDFNPSTNAVTFPNVNAPADCLGITLRDLSIVPDSIKITYNPTTDSILINAPGDVTFSLTKSCSFEVEAYENKQLGTIIKAEEESLKAEDAPLPAGAYCGSYLEIVSIRATVLSLIEVDLTGSVLGFGVACHTEEVKYDQTTFVVTFPNIGAPADCLGKLLMSYGLNPASLSGKYDPTKNTLDILVESITLTLSKCTSEQLNQDFELLKKPNKFHQARLAYLYETREQ